MKNNGSGDDGDEEKLLGLVLNREEEEEEEEGNGEDGTNSTSTRAHFHSKPGIINRQQHAHQHRRRRSLILRKILYPFKLIFSLPVRFRFPGGFSFPGLGLPSYTPISNPAKIDPNNHDYSTSSTSYYRFKFTKRYLTFLGISLVILSSISLGIGFGIGVGQWARSGVVKSVDGMIGEEEKTWMGWGLLRGYFGGVEGLVGLNGESLGMVKSRAYDPYPRWGEKEEGNGGYVECDYNDYEDHDHHHDHGHGNHEQGEEEEKEETPRLLRTRLRPQIRVFDGIPRGFPDPVFGSHKELGLLEGVCFDRYGRLGAYGFGYGVEVGGLGVGLGDKKKEGEGGEGPGTMPLQRIDWRGIDWGKVQGRCLERNKARFEMPLGGDSGDVHESKSVGTEDVIGLPVGPRSRQQIQQRQRQQKRANSKSKLKRTAFLLRTWDDYKYTSSDILNIRSIISELSINTGGLYTIHLLVHVRDSRIPIWSDKTAYTTHLHNSVPREFWGISTLWNEQLMELIYTSLPRNQFRDLPIHGVYRSSFMPVQWFAINHPEYEYFWNWEMDVRYSGHLWEFLEKADVWARKQPRKGLWERNERFWIPSVHGNEWKGFVEMVEKQVPVNETIWGPVEVPGVVVDLVKDNSYSSTTPPYPVTHQEKTPWGANEPADLLTFSPIFNPNTTTWLLSDDTTGYTSPSNPQPPRRANIIATTRLSHRLLTAMHLENAHHGHTAFTEMWPATCALHHGYKAVYIPHPVYIDRRWPGWYLEKTFNHGPRGASGGARESVFGEREHNFKGTSWYYNSAFGPRIWWRWLFGVDGEKGVGEKGKGNGGGGKKGKGETEGIKVEEGRMCLRGMLLHPVKDVPDRP